LRILLVHGMGRSPLSLWRLGRSLRREGHEVEFLWYHAGLAPFGRILARVRARVEWLAARGEPYAVIGHSLGGVLLRAVLPGVTPPPRHLVMIGTPNQPSRIAARLRHRWLFRLVNGEAGQRLSDPLFYATLPVPTVPYTIVAGNRGPRSRYGPFGDEANDLIVGVAETRIVPGDAPIIVNALHTFIMNHPDTRAAVLAALR
jgi:hypothetical protein